MTLPEVTSSVYRLHSMLLKRRFWLKMQPDRGGSRIDRLEAATAVHGKADRLELRFSVSAD